jgi:hypothetical protein
LTRVGFGHDGHLQPETFRGGLGSEVPAMLAVSGLDYLSDRYLLPKLFPQK